MRAFCGNLPVALVFLTVAGFSWIYGGASAPHLTSVIPWLWAFALETLLFIPQRRRGESMSEARLRVWKALARDPLTYVALSFMLILVMPMFNRGLCAVCDYPAILAGADPAPPIPYAPFCVNTAEHFGVVIWFVPALTAMLAVKHALSRSGKKRLVETLVWNGAVLAAFGFVHQATGAVSPYWGADENPVHFFSTFWYPNMAGAFFTALFAVSAGLWQDRVRADLNDRKLPEQDRETDPKAKYRPRWLGVHYMLVPTAFNFFAALATLSRAAIMLSFAIMVFWFVYLALALFTGKRKSVGRVKPYFGMLAGILLTAVAVFIFAPQEFSKEITTLSPEAVADRMTGKAQYHTRVATDIFKDYPLFGTGGWGYKHFCLNYMTDADRRQIQKIGGVNVHNDYLQFLCEHGVVGGALLAAVLLMLALPAFRSWGYEIKVANFTKHAALPRPAALFCIPASALGVLIAAAANLVHAFGDCVFRSPAVLSQFLLMLAAVEGLFYKDDE